MTNLELEKLEVQKQLYEEGQLEKETQEEMLYRLEIKWQECERTISE